MTHPPQGHRRPTRRYPCGGAARAPTPDRLDITGARWGLSGAEAVLKPRAVRVNGDFDACWTWHQQQEFIRNHQTRYRDHFIPTA